MWVEKVIVADILVPTERVEGTIVDVEVTAASDDVSSLFRPRETRKKHNEQKERKKE